LPVAYNPFGTSNKVCVVGV